MEVSQRRQLLQKRHPRLSISRQCRLLSLNRSSLYYRKRMNHQQENLRLAQMIRQIMLDCPCYGSRKVTESLRQRGFPVGRNRVRRLLCQLGLKALQPKRFRAKVRVETRKASYCLENLVLTEKNQVWATDISYIPTPSGWVYLTVILDVFSRKVLGHCLSSTLEAWPSVELLKRTIQRYGVPRILNSDQGSQFTSNAWFELAQDHGIQLSMAGKGRCYDNIHVERFFRTLKQESVYLSEYTSFKDAKSQIKQFIQYYNQRRIHAALNYNTPDTIYQQAALFRARPEQSLPLKTVFH